MGTVQQTAKTRVLVVGNGMVGHHFVEQLAQSPAFDISVLSAEPRLAYDRVQLSAFFADKTADDLALTDATHYQQLGVKFVLEAKVTHIDQQAKTVCTSTGQQYGYDKLVLATGSYPFVPPIPGKERAHCLVYRTIEDLVAIQASAKQGKVGVVVGGGLLGLEAAKALTQLGLVTHVVEFAPQLMGVQLDAAGGRLLRTMIEQLGVSVHTEQATQRIVDGEQCMHRMEFADGSHLETDVILFSAGIRPYDNLARESGLAVAERGGIRVNNQCLTSCPDIYAIGECASWQNVVFGLVAPGYQMAKVAADHLKGIINEFNGADMSTKLKLMGVDVGSIGDAHGNSAGALTYTYENQPKQIYKKIVISADRAKLLGAVLVGDTSDYDNLLHYALNGLALPDAPETLILPALNGEKPMLGANVLPDSAIICSCHNVSKCDIIQAIDQGATEFAAVKSCTKASTGCGGCATLLKNVFETELSHRGLAVNKNLCTHFIYSRTELFHIIKAERIRTFDQLLKQHGSGLGCEVCKPAVASMLASTWNDYILQPDHVSLQDTNDTYLANMQKDGTYSIVPRVAGGEITPEKLIVIGEVAKDYNLYTKITGGQRIDLFGARLEQLPSIWQRLIDAGMETGHAYGKSVRTVKSCVGSNWCRYGMQDSTSMAIFIENRYKGLRSPHKLKFAVSGCTRECAEAQSKDIGVIATDLGWNLYVSGNGGMKPRHADLFATDLDDDTLIQYIDRFLMFYIRMADRLQRTSVWLESLDGGLAYLQSVLIDDHLGINADLEAQMAHIIASYQCEWKTTLENPDALKRFRQFVNSDQADGNIQFVTERAQIRPATVHEKQRASTIAIQNITETV
jgi:nitrite reductase (NADH) large subunit